MLSAVVNENHDDWDDNLPYIMMGNRATLRKSTKLSPNFSMIVREASLPIYIMMCLPMRNAFDFAYKHLQSALQR